MSRCALYRHRDAALATIYIGISNDPEARTAGHRKSSPWFGDVVCVDIEWFDRRPLAEAAERVAIRTEKPKHNCHHSNTAQIVPEGSFRAGLLAEMARTGASIAEIVDATGVSRDVINKLIAREGSSTTAERALLIAAFFDKSVGEMITPASRLSPRHPAEGVPA